jgi:hypothetical protein
MVHREIPQACLAAKGVSISLILQRNNCLPAHLCSATFLQNLRCLCVFCGLGRNATFTGKFEGKKPVLTLDCKVVWYGTLKIDSKVIPVIYDPLISPSIKGCIYLYNSERDAIVQYAWNIVKDLLVDVEKVEKGTIKKAIDTKWKAARKQFTKGQVYAVTSQQEESTPVPPPESASRRWDSTDDDSFELEELG